MTQAVGEPAVGASSEAGSRSIPIRNLWILMLYAEEMAAANPAVRASAEENPDEIPELVGGLLVDAVRARFQRNLSPGYVRVHDSGSRPRGRIDVSATQRLGLDQRGVWLYRYDAHTVDTPRNRYVHETLRVVADRMARRGGAKNAAAIAREAASLSRTLAQAGVAAAPPPAYRVERETFGQHDRDDARVIRLARLFRELQVPSERAGGVSIRALERRPEWLRALFERAMFGLLRHTLEPDGWRVRHGLSLRWPLDGSTEGATRILPGMRTDIVIDDPQRTHRAIIDTKFNAITHAGHHGREALRSGYLYQIYAYVRSQESADDPASMIASGVLLHPCVGEDVDESVWMQGHRFRFATVDLAGDVATMRAQALRVIVEA